MRKNNIKRGAGTFEEYYRAIEIAKREIKTNSEEELRERIYLWILPRASIKM
jgi:hypothetical protein